MIIFPAIDIKDGKCVRLTRGDFDTAEQVADDALKTALGFRAAGARWIHMVDLDGAVAGKRVNEPLFTQVAQESGLDVELGGGIRDMASVDAYLARGIRRVILGTAALRDPDFLRAAVRKHGERVAAGIDAMNGRVRAAGWLEDGGADYIALAKRMEAAGVRTIIFTDISKDGALSGPNFEQLAALQAAVSCNIVASGGVTSLKDVRRLARMGLYGAILGKALYKGALSLSEAITEAAAARAEAAQQQPKG
ncbi:MAG: 1-(5-phosphoribosyl)-5-[(5-phosphoribosylamino)methylideneamino]imidazole-4-carboxamide isomerase [Clostridiales Family XIII bacterium]|jgi:phosphoribosylformimino-5-aminoimidazole carboxamide ribotide isomerase|nr:1-(5-phosphoribosyl)-5-[(5-phosphoribosylamino)methylideneamino]imidazole-4-carboxamide isomerase [Clostridiales Family XIII bacterium]